MSKAKRFMPIDELVAEYLRDAIATSGVTYRDIADSTGMSINRIGIILRREQPPATIGEIGMIADVIGLSASDLVARADESARRAETKLDEIRQRKARLKE